jgi:hypothetical protein
MSNLGFGVMIGLLSGNEETVNAVKSSLGKEIASVHLDSEKNSLGFKFTDGTSLYLWDDGQSCCESRYMRTDDKLSDFTGATLLDLELKKAAPINDSEYGDHEIQFLDVKTSKGTFQMASHNEHNGYYGGFHIIARLNAP